MRLIVPMLLVVALVGWFAANVDVSHAPQDGALVRYVYRDAKLVSAAPDDLRTPIGMAIHPLLIAALLLLMSLGALVAFTCDPRVLPAARPVLHRALPQPGKESLQLGFEHRPVVTERFGEVLQSVW